MNTYNLFTKIVLQVHIWYWTEKGHIQFIHRFINQFFGDTLIS